MADRRIVDDGQISSMRKIGRNRHLIAGAAGHAASTLAVLKLLRSGARTPDELLPAIDAASCALVLDVSGRLWQLQDGAAWPLPRGVHAIGSGADLALGFLAGAHATHPAAARRALRFVARRRADCGDGTTLIERP